MFVIHNSVIFVVILNVITLRDLSQLARHNRSMIDKKQGSDIVRNCLLLTFMYAFGAFSRLEVEKFR